MGSKDGAKALMSSWAGECVVHSNVSPELMPQKVVDQLNHQAQTVLSSYSSKVSRQQIQDRLLVLYLTWSAELDYLVHTVGIEKRFGACNDKHMMSFFQTMLQNTFPNRNTSVNY